MGVQALIRVWQKAHHVGSDGAKAHGPKRNSAMGVDLRLGMMMAEGRLGPSSPTESNWLLFEAKFQCVPPRLNLNRAQTRALFAHRLRSMAVAGHQGPPHRPSLPVAVAIRNMNQTLQ